MSSTLRHIRRESKQAFVDIWTNPDTTSRYFEKGKVLMVKVRVEPI